MNSTLMPLAMKAVAISGLLLSSLAHAHFPTLVCDVAGSQSERLYCEAGYSDASLAGVVELQVFSYDEVLLKTVTTATDGTVELNMPEGEFYIKFDANHESPAEFDYAEL